MPHSLRDSLEQIPTDESNFVYVSHKLIVEMRQNMLWFWDASKDSHGTTHCHLSSSETKWKEFATSDEDSGQWTRVMTMPHAVATALKRAAVSDFNGNELSGKRRK